MLETLQGIFLILTFISFTALDSDTPVVYAVSAVLLLFTGILFYIGKDR